MNKGARYLTVLGIFLAFLSQPVSGAPQGDWRAKVVPQVFKDVGTDGGEFILFLKEQADLSGAERLQTKAEKGRYVYQQLTATAQRTQAQLLARLQALQKAAPGSLDYRPYWVANMIWVRGDAQALQALAQQPEVGSVFANPHIRADLPEQSAPPARPDASAAADAAVPWGLTKVGAPQVWASGITGQNVVVGGQDTGYMWDHPALKNQYRGWNGASAEHNFNWHDAIHSANSYCPKDSPAPCDDSGHGTHTMGTMVGDDHLGNQIGMAPGARWIGCRNMNKGLGTPITYSECYQWFIAPTDLQGNNANPDLSPDVINNSWSCPPSEGCLESAPNVLLTAVDSVRAAGIVTVHSAGNSGPYCSSISTPAAIYDASFTVGNTDSSDGLAWTSSRGPVIIDGSNRLKPDVSAPGTYVYSSVPAFYSASLYAYMSGTSMAGPHVAGMVALLISADPNLRGHVDAIENLIRTHAQPLPIAAGAVETCGGTPSNQVPNNSYGWGRIDALTTVNALHRLAIGKRASKLLYAPGDQITYTLMFTNTYTLAESNVVVSDALPAGVSFVSATPGYSQVGDTLSWSFSTLAAGAHASVQLVVQVPQQNPPDRVVNDQYDIRSNGFTLPLAPPAVSSYLATVKVPLPFLFR